MVTLHGKELGGIEHRDGRWRSRKARHVHGKCTGLVGLASTEDLRGKGKMPIGGERNEMGCCV